MLPTLTRRARRKILIPAIASAPTPHSGFRPNVEGLRALAILVVVFYHAHVPGFSGGYVGVDVFYVLSGFLITGLLVRDIEQKGRLDFLQFYARRTRRLLPAAAFVLVATLVAGRLLLAPEEQRQLAVTGVFNSAYASNLHFARSATDYLAAEAELNPLMHTWSLAVEEQFYFVWPLFVALAFAGARRTRLLVSIGVASALSLSASVVLTHTAQPWAFYGSPLRAWEFGFGALACLKAVRLRRGVLLGGGLAALLVAVASFAATTPFPGVAALLPVLGTCALLAAGEPERPTGIDRVLRTGTVQWIGRLSYSWYLWHWPVLVYADVVWPGLGWLERLALSAGSLGLAYLTYRAIENPIRHWKLLVPRPVLSLTIAGGVTILCVGMSLGFRSLALSALRSPAQRLYTRAYGDRAAIYDNGCHLGYLQTSSPDCTYGDLDSPRTVVLLGDSHAAHWLPALESIARERHWRVLLRTKSSCPAVRVSLVDRKLKRPYRECDIWRDRQLAAIREEHPSLVVLANSASYVRDHEVSLEVWRGGLRETLSALSEADVPVLLLRDMPYAGFSVPNCLARAAWRGRDSATCDFTRNPVAGLVAVARAEAARSGARYVDLSRYACDGDHCHALHEGLVRYIDDDHMTTSFARALAPALADALSL